MALVALAAGASAQLYPSAWLRLTDDSNWDRHASWSPDQQSLAFVRDHGSGMHLVVIDADGSNRRELTDGTDFLFHPSWFPDGDRVVVDVQNKGLVVIDLATGDQEFLFEPGPSPQTPALSPDGLRLAYGATTPEHSSNLYVSDLDGGNAVRLTNHENQDNNPTWAPDGSAIAFESQRESPPGVFVINVDGSGLRRITPDTMQGLQPSWSPDGTRIAFAGYESGNENLYVVNVDGSGLRRLTLSERSVGPEFPAWSPDGRFLAFHAFGHGNADIFLLDMAVAMSAVLDESWGSLKSETAP
jgi:TolB protein